MAEYETIQAQGQTVNVSDHGGTYENKLIDMSTGQTFEIYADGHNPTVRNIGFKGQASNHNFAINAAASLGASGTVTIENIYLGDGVNFDNTSFDHGAGAMFIHPNDAPDIDRVEVRNCCVRGWTNNGCYLSNHDNVHWENCYTVNCGVSHYRAKGGSMTNCVGYNSANERYGAGNGGERFGRIVWSWPAGTIDIYESHIDQGDGVLQAIWPQANTNASRVDYHSGQFNGEVRTDHGGIYNEDSAVGNNPSREPPEGVPLSAEAAASGEGGGGGTSRYEDDCHVRPSTESNYDELLTFREPSQEAFFEFWTTGEIKNSDPYEATLNDTVECGEDGEYYYIDGYCAPDEVNGFFFNGELVAANSDYAPGEFWLSGSQVDIDDWPDDPFEEEFDPDLVTIGSCTLDPENITAGESAELSAVVSNENGVAAVADIDALVSGEVHDTVSATIDAGESETVTTTITPPVGEHDIVLEFIDVREA